MRLAKANHKLQYLFTTNDLTSAATINNKWLNLPWAPAEDPQATVGHECLISMELWMSSELQLQFVLGGVSKPEVEPNLLTKGHYLIKTLITFSLDPSLSAETIHNK